MRNIYIEFETSDLTPEDHDTKGKYLDAMKVFCHQHGLLISYAYDERVDWQHLMNFVSKHQAGMHFA